LLDLLRAVLIAAKQTSVADCSGPKVRMAARRRATFEARAKWDRRALDFRFDNSRRQTMMSMQKGATAWEKEPQRKMRAVLLYTFMSGVCVGGAIGEIHEHRWKSIAFSLCIAALISYNAWSRWKKIAMPA
jgi:hypothetical protein